MGYTSEFVECFCRSHAISVSTYKDDKGKYDDFEIYLSLWSGAELNNNNFKWRLKRAWDAFRGNLHLDSICLDPVETDKLVKALQRAQERLTNG